MKKKVNIKNMLIDVVRNVTGADIKINGAPKNPVRLYGSNDPTVKEIQVKDIRIPRSWKIRENLFEWKNNDFAMYFIEQFKAKVSSSWSIKKVGFTLQIGRIREKLVSEYGFCDNLVLKNYMDFFIDNWGYYYYKKAGGEFYISNIKQNEPIGDFINKYDYGKNFTDIMNPIDNKKDGKISGEDIGKVFLVGPESLILEYGLLLPLNWLVMSKKFSLDRATDYISSAFQHIYNRGSWKMIIDVTETLSPYPEWFVVRDFQLIMDRAQVDVLINVEFNEDASWCVF